MKIKTVYSLRLQWNKTRNKHKKKDGKHLLAKIHLLNKY